MHSTDTRRVIRMETADVPALAEFLSMLLDAPMSITAAGVEVPTPGERHLILIAAEAPEMRGVA